MLLSSEVWETYFWEIEYIDKQVNKTLILLIVTGQ